MRQVPGCGAVQQVQQVQQVQRVQRVQQVRRVRSTWVVLLALLTGLPLVAAAQAPPATAAVEVEPVTCWWRTGVATVRMGEPFEVLLTCSILETEAARAVVDRSQLGAAAVQFPPYEVVGGTESADHVTAGRRFVQYRYVLRLISESAFGVDVPIPGFEIEYRIESQVEGDAALQGREQRYLLPAMPMRVASLVPETAAHIREAPVPTLADIAAREFRARMFRLVALILLGVSVLTLALAVGRWARQRRAAGVPVERHQLPHRAVLAGVRRELQAVQRATRGVGWTPEALTRTLAAARIVASYLGGGVVAQRVLDGAARDGELVLSRGGLSPVRVAVSGAATAAALRAAAVGSSVAADLDRALARLTTARYGREAALDSASLDDALEAVVRAADQVAARHTWLTEQMTALRVSARGWRPRAWAR